MVGRLWWDDDNYILKYINKINNCLFALFCRRGVVAFNYAHLWDWRIYLRNFDDDNYHFCHRCYRR